MSVKSDLLKEINAKAKRKKELSKALTREQTIAFFVAEFFKEMDKIGGFLSSGLTGMAIMRLESNLKNLDRGCAVVFKSPNTPEETHRIEIRWSAPYVEKNNCEPVMVLDAAEASFQNALEQL